MIFVLTYVQVLDEPVAFGEVSFYSVPQSIELLCVKGTIHATPFNAVLGTWFANDEAVGR